VVLAVVNWLRRTSATHRLTDSDDRHTEAPPISVRRGSGMSWSYSSDFSKSVRFPCLIPAWRSAQY